ncbi:MAG: hypothetical protein Q4E01_05425 [Actinomycetaceae bacterium]|nr:hypothetical protein [Actinomycetaceae bacterium]
MTPRAHTIHTALDPTPDEARQLLDTELSRLEYRSQKGPLDYIIEWLLRNTDTSALTSPGTFNWVLTAIILVVLAALTLSIYTRVKKETQTTQKTREHHQTTVEEQLQHAHTHRQNNPTEAIKAGFRAIILTLDQTTAASAPGRTVGDIAHLIETKYPDLTQTATQAASKFDIAAYSLETIEPITTTDVDTVLALQTELSKRLTAEVPA